MITKETARDVYNCYVQIEAIEKLKEDMLKEVKRVREFQEKQTQPFPEKDNGFGRFGKGLQLGVPDGTAMRIYNVSPALAVAVMDEQKKYLEQRLLELKAIIKLEMSEK